MSEKHDDIVDNDNPEWTDANTGPLDYAMKLKATRARLRLSQKAFADLLHIPTATLRNWEQRRTEPDALSITTIDLIYDDPHGMRERLERMATA